MTIADREDELFKHWEAKRPNLVRDGVVKEAAYTSSQPRVVIVLKEVNDKGGGGWDLRSVLREGMRWQTWNPVTRWMRGLRELERSLSWHEVEPVDAEARLNAVRSLCVINLKKEPGGASSDWSSIVRYAREDAAFLNKQFQLYDPEVVICGGVGDIFKSVIDLGVSGGWDRTSRGVRYLEFGKSQQVYSYYHPQARFPQDMLYYTLIDAVREVRGYS